jgi:hypothetical protein
MKLNIILILISKWRKCPYERLATVVEFVWMKKKVEDWFHLANAMGRFMKIA